MGENHERRKPAAQDPGAPEGSGSGGASASKEELAEDRTSWARERTLLAKQRTFGAWLRTGLAAVAVGFAAARLLGDLQPGWAIQVASGTLMLAGVVTFVVGFFTYRDTFRKLEREGVIGTPVYVVAAITGALVLGALILLASVVLQ